MNAHSSPCGRQPSDQVSQRGLLYMSLPIGCSHPPSSFIIIIIIIIT